MEGQWLESWSGVAGWKEGRADRAQRKKERKKEKKKERRKEGKKKRHSNRLN
jgi:hypothetical protein